MGTDDDERIGLGRLAIFSLPMLVVLAIEIPWRSYLPALFTETLGLPLVQVGTLLLAIRLFDMLLDPLIGWASDSLPTRFGQRRPWMVASVPLILLGVWQVYFVAPGTSLAALAVGCLVLHLGYTMMVTPHGGWSLEIGRGSADRTRVMVARTWFAVAGMPLLILLPSILERGFGATRATQVAAMGVLLLSLAPLTILLVVRSIAEPPAARAAQGGTGDPLRQFLVLLREPALRAILLLYALAGVAEAASSTTFIFFVERTLGLRGWASSLLLLQALVTLAALPLWGAVGIRLGKRRALIAVLAWQAASTLFALLLPAGALAPLIGFLLMRSIASGADFMLLRAMVADVAADDVSAGMRRAGGYYAQFNVTLKLAMSLGAGGALWLLALAGFTPDEAGSDGASGTIRLAYALPGCVAGLLGIALLLAPARNRARPTPIGTFRKAPCRS